MPITAVADEKTRKVIFAGIFENLVITQKYESFACDIIMEPAPIASMVNSLPLLLARPSMGSIGATIEAAVIIATVDDPCAVFKIDAMAKGIISPSPVVLKAKPALVPTPVSFIILPNMPPAAVTIRIGPAFSMAVSKTAFKVATFRFRKRSKENATPISNAMTGCPIKKINFKNFPGESGRMMCINDAVAINTSGIITGKNDRSTDGFLNSCFNPGYSSSAAGK